MRSLPSFLTSYYGCNHLNQLTFCCFVSALTFVQSPNTAALTCYTLIWLPLSSTSLFSLLFVAAPCFSVTSCVCPPSSESQAHWLFQSPTHSKPLLGSTTAAGLVGSYRSRRAHLCFCTSEPLMTGGRDDIMEWMDWCPTSTSWSKTSEMCSTRKSYEYLA